MIQQPELGKKIADYRKSKGFTQEELVEKCNLSVRTLQRIEAGEVTPRSYTVRLIFEVLELDFENSLQSQNENKRRTKKWLEQVYISFIDLFNLKTNTMKKISILSLAIIVIVWGFSSLTNQIFAQSKVRNQIEKSNADFVKWFNNGEINSIVNLYSEDACLVSRGCGQDFIKNYYTIESKKFKFTEIKIVNVEVNDTVAIEKGKWSAILSSGQSIGGEYVAEWRYAKDKWVIVSEASGL
ncbi:helix-turn-helix domain-containing protein [Flavobacterium ustbae]|uniref:helix-turn-helix domain-containing protein n=1 Tax=Flavobacterium ustbae TaxID=2488790 RepID=UPI0019D1C19D|nr:helix-turn-helix domain-containing protein [Flavobacterium ustbae]